MKDRSGEVWESVIRTVGVVLETTDDGEARGSLHRVLVLESGFGSTPGTVDLWHESEGREWERSKGMRRHA